MLTAFRSLLGWLGHLLGLGTTKALGARSEYCYDLDQNAAMPTWKESHQLTQYHPHGNNAIDMQI